jgi:hypothetical protein
VGEDRRSFTRIGLYCVSVCVCQVCGCQFVGVSLWVSVCGCQFVGLAGHASVGCVFVWGGGVVSVCTHMYFLSLSPHLYPSLPLSCARVLSLSFLSLSPDSFALSLSLTHTHTLSLTTKKNIRIAQSNLGSMSPVKANDHGSELADAPLGMGGRHARASAAVGRASDSFERLCNRCGGGGGQGGGGQVRASL